MLELPSPIPSRGAPGAAARALTLALALGAFVGCSCGTEPRRPPGGGTEATADFEAVELAGGIAWRAGRPFLARRPSAELRTAEYGVSGHPDAELAVFHFGTGEGGSVADNVGRWLDQLTQPDGRPTREVAEIEERELEGLDVTVVDATGSFSGVRGTGAEDARAGFRLLGAIVSAPEGLVFFKLLGPREGVAAAEPAFQALLASIRVAR